ncbi:MAG: Eco57I restriction-modification methylase domain-containing protein [Bdellovibrionaceae bacterium]|nr:Eco57I restriction-modification methylase domain-containing protein [Pseudobdellovibrionaceae bacterium]
MGAIAIKPTIAHTVDTLAHVIGRDQPIMAMEKALEMAALLGEEVFADENVVFFDPFCKAGELLLACAFHSCWAKSKGKAKLLDVDMVMKEIYQSNRYFGLAPDERHHRLSIRTFLGNENSHKEEFNHIIRDGHYLSEEDGTLNKEKYEKEIKDMIEYINSKTKNKKIIAVGNPPYQEEDGGAQKSARPIYQLFVEKLITEPLISDFVLVIPSRWFAGGKGLDNFRNQMMSSTQLKQIKHFERSGEVFPTVDIDGGVCFVNWQSSYNGKPTFFTSEHSIELDLNGYDIIPDDPMAYSLLEKMRNIWSNNWVSDVAWSRKPFGLPTDYFQKNKSENPNGLDVVKCIGRNKTVNYIKKSNIPQKTDQINKYKVCIPGAYGGKKGQRRKTLPASSIFIAKPGEILTETYMVIDTFDNEKQAKNLVRYLGTTFSRYFLGLRKITQHIPRERWAWVPYLDMSKEWTDESIYNYFKFSKDEIEHIKKKVQEWS